MTKNKTKDPNCIECHHFFVTWDRHNPRGCHKFGIKTRELPSVVVRRSAGAPCPAFLAKQK